MAYSGAIKQEALRLRIEDRQSLDEISEALGISKSTASSWLRAHPLTAKERQERNRRPKSGRPLNYPNGRSKDSRFLELVNVGKLTSNQKGRIAESAVAFRLALLGYEIYGGSSDGNKVDWIISDPETGKTAKLQVRWASITTGAEPSFKLTCSAGRRKTRRLTEREFDFVVAYCLDDDTAYVYSFKETAHIKTQKTVSGDAAEAWSKLNLVLSSKG